MPAPVRTVDQPNGGAARRGLPAALVLALALLVGLGASQQARAFDFAPGTFTAGTLTQDDDDNAFFQQAGGRTPFGVTDFTVQTDDNGEPIGRTSSASGSAATSRSSGARRSTCRSRSTT